MVVAMEIGTTDRGVSGGSPTGELWRSYAATGDPQLRDRLVLTLAPMVNFIVNRKIGEIPTGINAEDVIEQGLLAVVLSIDRYEPDAGGSLEQFVWTQVHGAVIVYLGRGQPAQRSLRACALEIARVQQDFTSLHARPPTRTELRHALGMTVEDATGCKPLHDTTPVEPVRGDEQNGISDVC